MMFRALASQPDLFAAEATPTEDAPARDPAMAARIEAELAGELARLAALDRFPWPDLTASALAELRFDSLSRWVAEPRGAALRAAHAAALDRLCALHAGSA